MSESGWKCVLGWIHKHALDLFNISFLGIVYLKHVRTSSGCCTSGHPPLYVVMVCPDILWMLWWSVYDFNWLQLNVRISGNLSRRLPVQSPAMDSMFPAMWAQRPCNAPVTIPAEPCPGRLWILPYPCNIGNFWRTYTYIGFDAFELYQTYQGQREEIGRGNQG